MTPFEYPYLIEEMLGTGILSALLSQSYNFINNSIKIENRYLRDNTLHLYALFIKDNGTPIDMLNKVIDNVNPDYALIAFDTDKKTFRHEEYKDYIYTDKFFIIYFFS